MPLPPAPDVLVGGRERERRRLPLGAVLAVGLLVAAGGALALTTGRDRPTPPAPVPAVDLSVAVAAGYTCVPEFFRPQVVLAAPDAAVVGRLPGTVTLAYARGAATLSYTGPRLTAEDLLAVRGALAHSCGTPVEQVRTRP